MIIALLLAWAIPALADYNPTYFYLDNQTTDKTLAIEVRGARGTSSYYSITIAEPGQIADIMAETCAWWLSDTTYYYDINIYIVEDSGGSVSGEQMGSITLQCKNMYILWPTWLYFHVISTSVDQGNLRVSTDMDSVAYAASVTVEAWL